jgi:hypothetical protein
MNINLDSIITLNDKIIVIVNQISLSLLILLVGFIIGKLVDKFSLLLIRNSSFRKIKIFSRDFNTEKIIPKLLSYVIYIASLIFALSYSGILNTVIFIILIIFALTMIVSVFYSIKESFPNFVASIRLRRNPNFRLRRKIQVNGILGEISEITYSEIKITTESGDEIYVPCKVLLSREYKLLK